MARYKSGLPRLALGEYNKLTRLHANHFDGHHFAAIVHSELGEHAQAAASYQEAVRCAPTSDDALLGLGRSLLKAGSPAKAAAAVERVHPHRAAESAALLMDLVDDGRTASRDLQRSALSAS